MRSKWGIRRIGEGVSCRGYVGPGTARGAVELASPCGVWALGAGWGREEKEGEERSGVECGRGNSNETRRDEMIKEDSEMQRERLDRLLPAIHPSCSCVSH